MRRKFPTMVTQEETLFARTADVFTLENEWLTAHELKRILAEKIEFLFPQLESYEVLSNKIKQRELFDRLSLPSPRWMAIRGMEDLEELKSSFDFPYILKVSRGGYDGKGVRLIKNQIDLESALNDFDFYDGNVLLVEEKIELLREVSQGFIQNHQQSSLLPLVETYQRNGICQHVFYPSEASEKEALDIRQILKRLMLYPLIGLFNIEFFIDTDQKVYINEIAPRPHNSQHLTINASSLSQFDLLALYLIDHPMIPPQVETFPSAMVNILGRSSSEHYKLTLPMINQNVSITTKLYEKKDSQPGRKMGHVNLVDPNGSVDLKVLALTLFKDYHI